MKGKRKAIFARSAASSTTEKRTIMRKSATTAVSGFV